MPKSTYSLASITTLMLIQVFALSVAYAETKERALSVEANEYRYHKPFSPELSSAVPPRTASQGMRRERGNDLQSIKQKKQRREQRHFSNTKAAPLDSTSSINEFWIYESIVTLDNDIDYDGYYSTFSIEFDADTIFTSTPVYAVLYIGKNELYDAIHVSSEFFIYGEEATDSFTIESTLLSGFPTNDYDLLLELYDANTEVLVAFTNGYDDVALTLLPLESKDNEYVTEEVIVVEEYGGSWSFLSSFFLFGFLVFRTIRYNLML